MNQAFHKTLPTSIQTLYNTTQRIRSSRQNSTLNTVEKSTKIQNLRPSVCGPYIWNNLPLNIRSLSSIKSYQIKLKKSLIAAY